MNEIDSRIGKEWMLSKKSYDDSVSPEKQRIDTTRQVEITYGNHQQSNTPI